MKHRPEVGDAKPSAIGYDWPDISIRPCYASRARRNQSPTVSRARCGTSQGISTLVEIFLETRSVEDLTEVRWRVTALINAIIADTQTRTNRPFAA